MTGETTTVPAGRDVAGRGPYSHRTWVMVIGALLAVATVALVWLSVVARQPGNGIIAIIIGVPSAGVGLVVARRLPASACG